MVLNRRTIGCIGLMVKRVIQVIIISKSDNKDEIIVKEYL